MQQHGVIPLNFIFIQISEKTLFVARKTKVQILEFILEGEKAYQRGATTTTIKEKVPSFFMGKEKPFHLERLSGNLMLVAGPIGFKYKMALIGTLQSLLQNVCWAY